MYYYIISQLPNSPNAKMIIQTHTLFFLSGISLVSELESFEQRNSWIEILGPHERAGSFGLCLEVSDAIDAAIVLAVSIVPIDSDPCPRIALDGSHVPHCSNSPWISSRVNSLAESELAFWLGFFHHLLLLPLLSIWEWESDLLAGRFMNNTHSATSRVEL